MDGRGKLYENYLEKAFYLGTTRWMREGRDLLWRQILSRQKLHTELLVGSNLWFYTKVATYVT